MARNIPVFEWTPPAAHVGAGTVAYLAIAVPSNHHVIGVFNLRDSLAHILDTPPALFTTNEISTAIELCINSTLEDLGQGIHLFEVHAIPCSVSVCDKLDLFHPEIPTDPNLLKSFLESVLATHSVDFKGVVSINDPQPTPLPASTSASGFVFFPPPVTPAVSPIPESPDREEEELTSAMGSFRLSNPYTHK